jgi:hypothetical protein
MGVEDWGWGPQWKKGVNIDEGGGDRLGTDTLFTLELQGLHMTSLGHRSCLSVAAFTIFVLASSASPSVTQTSLKLYHLFSK